jgi:hypothetical protein
VRFTTSNTLLALWPSSLGTHAAIGTIQSADSTAAGSRRKGSQAGGEMD